MASCFPRSGVSRQKVLFGDPWLRRHGGKHPPGSRGPHHCWGSALTPGTSSELPGTSKPASHIKEPREGRVWLQNNYKK